MSERKLDKTLCANDAQLDMLESAIGQLWVREPKWRPQVESFANKNYLVRTKKMVAAIKEERAKRQLSMEETFRE